MNKFICIHGHFYQPPRENPWLEAVELQDSAYPYHDWNERVTAECYGPNTASRILDAEGRIEEIVNNYSKISFNFGPTLLSWLEQHKPEFYQAVLDADRLSQTAFSGHGSALAQVFNHMIMPLANRRDKYTQVYWGLRDFERRFARKPEGMWLAEAAVDLETLDIMAELGIKFTILGPDQAKRFRKIGEKRWKDVTGGRIDPKRAYVCHLPSGRDIHLFFYDGPISHDLAFGNLLQNGGQFAERLLGVFTEEEEGETSQLVHIATDGETYGHHHRYGDMALTYCLHSIESEGEARLTVYGEFLEKNPPTCEVEIYENTSWSCVHGVERWRSNCGDNTHPGWQQEWRAPLRQAMDWLRDTLAPLYEREMGLLGRDPWKIRDEYIEVILDRSRESMERFLADHALRPLAEEEKVRFLKLLEMQRQAQQMYTSCGWFFDEISGIETVQILMYAARAIQLAEEAGGQNQEAYFLRILEHAPSNLPAYANGAAVWEALVKPAVSDLFKVSAHYAVSSLFREYAPKESIYCYSVQNIAYDWDERGGQKLALGRAKISSNITWESQDIAFASLHLGNHNLLGGVRPYAGDENFAHFQDELKKAFTKSDLPEIVRLMDAHFGQQKYTLWHLFKDEQRKILDQILASTMQEIEVAFRQIYERYYSSMQVMHDMGVPLPSALASTIEFILNIDLKNHLENEKPDLVQLGKVVEEVRRWSFKPDKATLDFVASSRLLSLMEQYYRFPFDLAWPNAIVEILASLSPLGLELDLWKIQNLYFAMDKEHLAALQAKAEQGDETAKPWLEAFGRLGQALGVSGSASPEK